MLERIHLLRNIGQFDNVSPAQETALTPFSLIYGENGRGKTTLAAILRSLSTNNPTFVEERKRLGAEHAPHIIIENAGAQCICQNGAWSQSAPNIAIFDDLFVTENVCSGIDVQADHRRGLHELILGAQGVALNETLQTHVQRIEAHNIDLRKLGDAIPAAARGPYKVDAFCKLEQDDEIEAKIQEAERRLAAAKASDQIRQRPGFQEFSIPDFDIDDLGKVLDLSLPDIEQEAVEKVQAHISKLGRAGEGWIGEGMPWPAPSRWSTG